MSMKLWDWDNKWECTSSFEGHAHYVMMCKFNLKDTNTFASASLDRTIKVQKQMFITYSYPLLGVGFGSPTASLLPRRPRARRELHWLLSWRYLPHHNCFSNNIILQAISLTYFRVQTIKLWRSGTIRRRLVRHRVHVQEHCWLLVQVSKHLKDIQITFVPCFSTLGYPCSFLPRRMGLFASGMRQPTVQKQHWIMA